MSLRILHLSDAHLFVDPAARLNWVCTRNRWEQILQTILPELEQVDRLMITGDFTHDDLPETYRAVRSTLDPWWHKVRLVPGNHDVREGMRLHCGDRLEVVHERNVFQETHGCWRLIGLDSQLTGDVRGELGFPQLEWLDRQLATDPECPAALFLHHPPITAGSHWMNEVGLTDRDLFWQMIDKHPQVRLICCGHVHHESATFRHGVLVLTTPSTGVQFFPESETLRIDTVAPGYRVLELEDDGEVRTRVMRVSPIDAGNGDHATQ